MQELRFLTHTLWKFKNKDKLSSKNYRMKKINLIIGLCLVTLGGIHSQTIDVDNYFSGLNVVTEKGGLPDGVIGSSYITDEFQPAKISTDDKTYAVRYNAYRDEMEIQHNNQNYYLTKTVGFTITFITDNKVYQSFPLPENAGKTGFFVVLAAGDKGTVLLREKITFIEGSQSSTGYDSAQPPQFKRQKDTFYLYRNGMATEITTKKKDFLNLFGAQSKQVESYMKKEKLNPKKAEDLSQIFTYYNSL